VLLFLCPTILFAQSNPAITHWMLNTSDVLGSHYIAGSSSVIPDTMHANVLSVQYSNDYAYIRCAGIPSYAIGPYQDGNPSQATNRNYLFQIPLSPQMQTGTPTSVGLGQIGVLVNGIPLFNCSDARYYSTNAQGWATTGTWERNAVYFENLGFDCAKGHPAPVFNGPPGQGTIIGGSYHHHQNPSAFDVANTPWSSVCDLYPADGLYVPNSSQHSPLLGFAFDGFPIYGGYGFQDPMDATSPVVLITPSYQIKSLTDRTSLTPGGAVLPTASQGPDIVSVPLGAFIQDYEYIDLSGMLDAHNGRFCVTPEYPNGTYAYFATIDVEGNSVYPYFVGPTYYGVAVTDNFPVPGSTASTGVSINETVQTYTPTSVMEEDVQVRVLTYPNPANEYLIVQLPQAPYCNVKVEVYDVQGKLVCNKWINAGSTMLIVDVQTWYAGTYNLVVSTELQRYTQQVIIQ
jgi:hypothetical protein